MHKHIYVLHVAVWTSQTPRCCVHLLYSTLEMHSEAFVCLCSKITRGLLLSSLMKQVCVHEWLRFRGDLCAFCLTWARLLAGSWQAGSLQRAGGAEVYMLMWQLCWSKEMQHSLPLMGSWCLAPPPESNGVHRQEHGSDQREKERRLGWGAAEEWGKEWDKWRMRGRGRDGRRLYRFDKNMKELFNYLSG